MPTIKPAITLSLTCKRDHKPAAFARANSYRIWIIQ